jgi:undecaprenyl diphosphate synthase
MVNMSDRDTLPNHVGLILDGNRRWAKSRGVPTLDGHRQGAETFKTVALHAFDRGVSYVSAFVFSTENWSRTEEEVGYLMKLVTKAVEKYLDEFHERGIRILMAGRREGLDKAVLEAIDKTESKTAGNTAGTLVLCFNYGGQEELVDAVRAIISQGVSAEDITAKQLQEAMYVPDVPSVDLVIRTSGEHRTSGFMLYRAAYAELYFTDTYWPDFTPDDFDGALEEYARRERRFGE